MVFKKKEFEHLCLPIFDAIAYCLSKDPYISKNYQKLSGASYLEDGIYDSILILLAYQRAIYELEKKSITFEGDEPYYFEQRTEKKNEFETKYLSDFESYLNNTFALHLTMKKSHSPIEIWITQKDSQEKIALSDLQYNYHTQEIFKLIDTIGEDDTFEKEKEILDLIADHILNTKQWRRALKDLFEDSVSYFGPLTISATSFDVLGESFKSSCLSLPEELKDEIFNKITDTGKTISRSFKKIFKDKKDSNLELEF